MFMTRTFMLGIVAAAILSSAGCQQSPKAPPAEAPPATTANEHTHSEGDMEGFAIALAPTKGNSATGTVMLMSMGDGVHFSGVVSGLTPGPHGVHVHEKGDCSAPDASSAGGHFNPTGSNHGAPGTIPHHAGDLGNVVANANGRAELNVHVSGVSLETGENSIAGRSLIVHAGEDDLKTQPSGNSGDRIACGVIQAAN